MKTGLQWLAVIAAGCLVWGCSGGGKGGFSSRRSEGSAKAFRYSLVTSPTTLDPHKVEDGDTIDVLQQVFEGLVRWNEKSEVEGAVAESWELKDEGKSYVFKIRPGVKFHNGKEVTAEDVKWSFERACTPGLASSVAGTYLDDIVGVKERLAGTATEVTGVKVTGPMEVTVTIDAARPYFLAKLTYLTCAVMPKDSVPMDKPITSTTQMIGTGPFRAESYVADQEFRLSAFADYWGGKPQVETIVRPIITNAEIRTLKYRSGEIDLVQLERQQIAPFLKDDKFKDDVKYFDRPAIWYVGFSSTHYAPFAKRDVRRAFAMAINRKAIVDELLGGVNKIAEGILPPNIPGSREHPNGLSYNPAEAAKLLASAGYPGGQGLPPLELNFRNSRPDIQTAAVRIAEDLKVNLGVTVKVSAMDWTAYLEKRNRKELQLFHMRWGADYLDPQNFLSTLLATNGPENKSGYSNPAVDALCAQADKMPNGPGRWELYAKAEDMILQDAPWFPLYFQRDAELIRSRVKGLRESAFGHLPHVTVKIED